MGGQENFSRHKGVTFLQVQNHCYSNINGKFGAGETKDFVEEKDHESSQKGEL